MTIDREARIALADALMRLVYTYSPRDDYEIESLRLAKDALENYGFVAIAKEILADSPK